METAKNAPGLQGTEDGRWSPRWSIATSTGMQRKSDMQRTSQRAASTAASDVESANSQSAPPSPTRVELKYRRFFDRTLFINTPSIDARVAAGGRRWNYYYFQYILMGTLSMFEATQDPTYLEHALRWIETMISKATIIDRQGFRNWEGSWTDWRYTTPGVKIMTHLEDLQATTEFARAVRLIKTNPALASYGARADAVQEFVHNHIVRKIFVARNEEANYTSGFVGNLAGGLSDKPLLAICIFLDLHGAGAREFRPGRTYIALATEWLTRIKNDRITSPTYNGIEAAGAAILDFKKSWEPLRSSPDTEHENRQPEAFVRAYDAGVVIQLTDLQKLGRLFARIIWDGSTTAPRFKNYTDGDNYAYRNRGPWESGQIYRGWSWMGRFDSDALRAAEAMLDCIIAGATCSTPSKPYNDTLHGRIALSGNLSKVHAGR